MRSRTFGMMGLAVVVTAACGPQVTIASGATGSGGGTIVSSTTGNGGMGGMPTVNSSSGDTGGAGGMVTTVSSASSTTTASSSSGATATWPCDDSADGPMFWTCGGGTMPPGCDFTAPTWHYTPGQSCPHGDVHICVNGVPQIQDCQGKGCVQGPFGTNDKCNQ